MCKVSVIVPIYNAEKYLKKCIKSILKQSFEEFELILVNDGSKDTSLEICREYEKKDRRIRVIDKMNEGSILTRQRGVDTARAKYIMHVDADDWINKNAIKLLYDEAVISNADVVVANQYKVLSNTAMIKQANTSAYFKERKIYRNEDINTYLTSAYLHGHPFPSSLCAKLYKKSLLKHSHTYLDGIKFLGEDLFYNMGIFLNAKTVSILPKCVYYYRSGGFTSRYMPYLFSDTVRCYEIQKEVIESYYKDTEQKRMNGISIMLLNTFKTCLQNCFRGEHDRMAIQDMIRQYIDDSNIRESINNEGARRYFDTEYLDAIENNNVEYLFRIGEEGNQKFCKRQKVIKLATYIHL